MKKLLLVTGLVLAIGTGAYAQNITRSLQGSQDPRGPVGWDTSNFMYFPSHVNPGVGTSAGPVSNGAGTFVGVATDNSGIVSLGVSTGASVTFATPFNQTPACVVSGIGGTGTVSTPLLTVTTTGFIFQVGAAQANSQYAYLCFGNK